MGESREDGKGADGGYRDPWRYQAGTGYQGITEGWSGQPWVTDDHQWPQAAWGPWGAAPGHSTGQEGLVAAMNYQGGKGQDLRVGRGEKRTADGTRRALLRGKVRHLGVQRRAKAGGQSDWFRPCRSEGTRAHGGAGRPPPPRKDQKRG